MSSTLLNEMIVKYAGYSPVTLKERQEAEENLPYFINAINEAIRQNTQSCLQHLKIQQ